MFWLINLGNVPPGEYWYRQDGAPSWPPTPLVQELAATVADFRKGNQLPRATTQEAFEDIIRFTCDRLQNNPGWCYDVDKMPYSVNPSSGGGGCGGCNANI
jgi:hypothetical protein